nr:transposase, mutator type [Tanacetum cinerariifolium]
MKRIMNVQGVIDKCTGPLTPTATRIIESIKKETHLMKVQWNGANKYQVSSLLGDQCVVDVVGRPRKKRKRSKHKDEPFVKDGKLSRKGRTITCQSCRNTKHNKATYKRQGGNYAKASGSASRQAQKTEPAVGQDGSSGSGVSVVIGLSTTAGEGGACGPVSDNGNFPMIDEEEVTFKKLASMAEEMIMLIETLQIPTHLLEYQLIYEAWPLEQYQEDLVLSQWASQHSYQLDCFEMKIGFGWWWLSQGPCEGLGGGGYLRDYLRVVSGMDDGDSDSELLIPTPWSDESKNEKRAKRWRQEFEWKRSVFEIDFTFGINTFDLDKGIGIMKDKVNQENVCEEDVPLNNNIGKQIGDFVDMPSEAVEQETDANVPDEIDGAKGEQVLNHVVKKVTLNFWFVKRLQTLVLMN